MEGCNENNVKSSHNLLQRVQGNIKVYTPDEFVLHVWVQASIH